jgi:hypothetical protein
MTDPYTREYYDLLQSLCDTDDELAQREEKIKQDKLRNGAVVTGALVKAAKGLSRDDLAAVWNESYGKDPEWKPITNFLFPDSK